MTAHTMLAYETPDAHRADEVAAVWRVAWWAGLLWGLGQVLGAFGPYSIASAVLSGGWEGYSLSSRPFGWLYAAVSLSFLVSAAALVVVLLARAPRRVVAWFAGVALLAALAQTLCSALMSPAWGVRILSVVVFGSVLVRGLMWCGVMIVALAAIAPAWLTTRRLALVAALLLLPFPLGLSLDTYYFVTNGSSPASIRANLLSAQSIADTVGSLLLLLAVLLLLATAPLATRRRWPFAIVGITVLLVAVFQEGWRFWFTLTYSGLPQVTAGHVLHRASR